MNQHADSKTAGGDRPLSATSARAARARRKGLLFIVVVVMGPVKLSGAQTRPIRKEREKLRVARALRKRPRRRREKDLMRRKV
jgi:hypothetical protein